MVKLTLIIVGYNKFCYFYDFIHCSGHFFGHFCIDVLLFHFSDFVILAVSDKFLILSGKFFLNKLEFDQNLAFQSYFVMFMLEKN